MKDQDSGIQLIIQGHRPFAKDTKAGKAMKVVGVTTRKQSPVLPLCNSESQKI